MTALQPSPSMDRPTPAAVSEVSRPSVDMSSGVPLPKPLKSFAPFRDMLTVLRALSATAEPDAVAVDAELPETTTLGGTAPVAVALLLKPPADAAPPVASLRAALEAIAQSAGLRRTGGNGADDGADDGAGDGAGDGSAAGGSAAGTPLRPGLGGAGPAAAHDGEPATGAEAVPGRPALAALSLDDLAAAAEAETAFHAFLRDGMTALASGAPILGLAAELQQQLRAGGWQQQPALSDAGPAPETAQPDPRPDQRPDQQLGAFMRAIDRVLRGLVQNGAGPATFAMTIAQVYLAFAAPLLRLAAAGPAEEEDGGSGGGGGTGSRAVAGSGPPKAADHPRDAAAMLRALAARDAMAATGRDLALLSTDMGRLLAHHRVGLQQLRRARGFLTAVRATATDAQRRQPLGALLEAGRPAAAGMAASGQAALLRSLTQIGSEGGPLLEGLARAGAEAGDRPLAALLSAPPGTEADRLGQMLAEAGPAAVLRMTEEARTAARRLRGVLARETAAADRLSGQLEGLRDGRYSLSR